MNASSMSGQEKLLIALLGVLGLYGVYVGLGVTANRVACGGWEAPANPLAPVGFATSGDMSAFGSPGGCAASAVALGVALGVVVLIIAVVVVGIVFAVIRYKQSDLYLIRDINRRDGIAKRGEIAQWMGPKAAKRNTRELRPVLVDEKGKWKVKAEDAAYRMGASKGVICYASSEESMLLVGPPRSGKGVNVIVGAILDAPGPVVTTSTRADNYALTRDLRAGGGRPVSLFDPQGLTGQETTLKWSPITGCEDPQTANQRASSLIGAAGLDAGSSNAEWAGPATTIMECLLHAAALGRRSVDELMLWGTSPAEAKEAVRVLESHTGSARGWAAALKGIINEDPKMRANKWFGCSNAVKGLAVPSVRETLKPNSVEETFDIDRFIEESGTLYIIGTKTGGSSAGPFLIAMMDAITERAREIAAKKPGNRLDPPMSLILDEIANIATAWPALKQLMSDGGGVGISPMAVFQSMGQVESEWSQAAAKTLFEAATIKLQLGGASDTQHLKAIEELCGSREVTRVSRSHQRDGGSTSEQLHDVPVLRSDEIRRLPFGWGVSLFRKQRPIFINLRAYHARKDAKEIAASKKRYNEVLQGKDPERIAVEAERSTAAHLARAEATVAPDVSAGAPQVEPIQVTEPEVAQPVDPTAPAAPVGSTGGDDIEYG